MNRRPDIADLIRRGHSDTSIAQQLGCHRTTAARARRALGYPPVGELGRLYVEAAPTGRVKDYRPAHGLMPLAPAQQAANRARLLAALRQAA
jgi:hypothetical protein